MQIDPNLLDLCRGFSGSWETATDRAIPFLGFPFDRIRFQHIQLIDDGPIPKKPTDPVDFSSETYWVYLLPTDDGWQWQPINHNLRVYLDEYHGIYFSPVVSPHE